MTVSKTQRNILILLGAGAAAGLLGGLLGIGGGTLLIPIFVFLFGFDLRRAQGTSLAVIACLSFVGVLGYSEHGFIDWRIALCIVIGSVIGAIFGRQLVALSKSHLIRYILCAMLGLAGLRMILYGFGVDLFSAHLGQSVQGGVQDVAAYLSAGLITGLLSALLGVGGGLLVVPALVIFLGTGQHQAQGLSLAVMFPTAITGMLMHLRMGNVDLRVSKWTAVGAIIGVVTGFMLAFRMQMTTLQIIYGAFMCGMALLLALRKDKTNMAKTGIGVSDE